MATRAKTRDVPRRALKGRGGQSGPKEATSAPRSGSAGAFRVVLRPITQVTPYARNPRKNAPAVANVAASIKEFGFRQPIVVDSEGVIIAGHTRFLAALHLGLRQGPVHVAEGLTPAQVKAYRLADNRLSQDAQWDEELLALELGDLKGMDFDLGLTGFDAEELEALLHPSTGLKPGVDPDDVPPVPENPVTVLGDLIVLGRHRLICGDCTDMAVWDRLMDGDRSHLVVTSPPYNQRLDTFKPSGMQKENPAWVKRMASAYADSRPEPEYQQEQAAVIELLKSVTTNSGSVFYNHKHRYREKAVISPLEWLRLTSWTLRQEIIWDRGGSITLNARMFMPCDERIYWLTKGDFHFHDSAEIKSWSTIWAIAPKAESGVSAPFPVELPRRCIVACSDPGGIVADPYGGSGTTLIAAEIEGRDARLIELSPTYCDVIVQRWEQATGQKAVRP